MTIALLCPTRDRSGQFARMKQSVNATADSKVELYVAIQGVGHAYEVSSKEKVSVYAGHIADWPTGYTWNKLAEEALKNPANKLFMLAADDTVFSTPGWDKALLDHYNALESKVHVYHLLDSRSPEGTPHPIVTREYIEAMGYFLPPIFLHWMIDTWTVEIAKYNNCFTHFKDYQLIHDKPSDRGQGDETHTRIRVIGWHERDMWVAEKCQHYLELEKKRLREKIVSSLSLSQRANMKGFYPA